MRCIPHRGQHAPGPVGGGNALRRTGCRAQRQPPGVIAAACREALAAYAAFTHDTDDIGEPVAFYGTSAGGAVALQPAIGFPHLVRRLVLAAAGDPLPLFVCRSCSGSAHHPPQVNTGVIRTGNV